MNSVDEYINAMCEDFYRIFVRGENLDHRIGSIATTNSNTLGLDYDTYDEPESEDNLLHPIL